ncbi:MAG: alanine--glyoxylate aminotransferase family protein [Pseudomonadota bacterium]
MAVAAGRPFLAIPGPTTVPDEVLRAMHRPAVDIYTGELVGITERCQADLKRVFGTDGRMYIYAANGHGAWEAALSNTLSRGDTVLVLESGRFARGWGEMAALMGLKVETLEQTWEQAVDPVAVRARLAEDSAGAIKAVLVVQIDTASGVENDIAAIGRAVRDSGSPALFMVDTIASMGCVPFDMDAWGVDITVTGSQKGLMTPPGLSFVAAGPRAIEAHAQADCRTFYWDWTFREGEEHYQKYCGTPPEHLLFGLSKALELLFEEGLDAVHARHRLLAGATKAAVERWAQGEVLAFNVADPAQRSGSVTVVRMPEAEAAALRAFCETTCGVTIGGGIGALSKRAIRIAHMGHVNAPMMLGTLGAIELGLRTLKIPHGAGGVDAAIGHLAQHLAG